MTRFGQGMVCPAQRLAGTFDHVMACLPLCGRDLACSNTAASQPCALADPSEVHTTDVHVHAVAAAVMRALLHYACGMVWSELDTC